METLSYVRNVHCWAFYPPPPFRATPGYLAIDFSSPLQLLPPSFHFRLESSPFLVVKWVWGSNEVTIIRRGPQIRPSLRQPAASERMATSGKATYKRNLLRGQSFITVGIGAGLNLETDEYFCTSIYFAENFHTPLGNKYKMSYHYNKKFFRKFHTPNCPLTVFISSPILTRLGTQNYK